MHQRIDNWNDNPKPFICARHPEILDNLASYIQRIPHHLLRRRQPGLVEGKPGQDAGAGPAPVFAHLALRTDDADGAFRMLQAAGYQSRSEPHDLAAARARSGLLDGGGGFSVQVISYADDSPDSVTWDPAEGG